MFVWLVEAPTNDACTDDDDAAVAVVLAVLESVGFELRKRDSKLFDVEPGSDFVSVSTEFTGKSSGKKKSRIA